MTEPVQIFISYAREDQARAREIYRRVKDAGYKPWLDEEDLMPGQNFRLVIEKSLGGSDFVIICLSNTSVAKRSFFQREIKQALDKLQEMRPEDIFVIPARLDECEMPPELKDYHWVDLFDERGWEKLFRALAHGLRERGKTPPSSPVGEVTKEPWNLSPVDQSWTECLTHGLQIEMVALPGGEFTMGSNQYDDENPAASRSPFSLRDRQVRSHAGAVEGCDGQGQQSQRV